MSPCAAHQLSRRRRRGLGTHSLCCAQQRLHFPLRRAATPSRFPFPTQCSRLRGRADRSLLRLQHRGGAGLRDQHARVRGFYAADPLPAPFAAARLPGFGGGNPNGQRDLRAVRGRRSRRESGPQTDEPAATRLLRVATDAFRKWATALRATGTADLEAQFSWSYRRREICCTSANPARFGQRRSNAGQISVVCSTFGSRCLPRCPGWDTGTYLLGSADHHPRR